MRILVTGASGFVGSHIVKALVNAGYHVRCLVHTRALQPSNACVELFSGDILEPHTLPAAMAACDAIIHLVGIIRPLAKKNITFERLHVEATRNILEAAQQTGVNRYLHMSANGADSHNNKVAYLRTKGLAEELVRSSALNWTIFRPGLILGSGGAFTTMLRQQVQRLPFVPVIGDGIYPLMPVYVEDISRAFLAALTNRKSITQTYHCCGPTRCSYNELIDLFATTSGKVIMHKMHVPLPVMRCLADTLERFSAFPVTSEQITMLTGGNVCPESNWYRDLEITATPLADGIKKALGQ